MEERLVTILLVEDDPSMLDGIKDLLEMTPLEADDMLYMVSVLTAYDGLSGMAYVREHTPDLIISDIMMPRMTGYEFLHELRQNPDWLQIPFIFLTAKGEKGDYEKGRLRGADLYITKPFESDTFLDQITTQLHRSLKLKAIQHQHIEDLKKHILQILNHEFRTPLTYVTAYYEMLADGVNRPKTEVDYQEYLRGIQAGCIRLTSLVEDFLLVISLMSGESQERYHEKGHPIVDMQQLLQEAIHNSKKHAVCASINIETSCPPNLPIVWGVRSDLRNVLERLLDNAIKFSGGLDEPAQIQVTITHNKEELRIIIKDEGIGLPNPIQGKIFDLFFQYNRETREQQGAGTGLTIVKGLVELHKGTIEMESQEGKGSTFTVVLPIYTGEIKQPAEFTNEDAQPRLKATILAVEDDHNLLAGLEDLLETMDDEYELDVLTATNGLEGIEVLHKRLPDLIISDIMMPHMSGFEFLREVRKNLDWLHIPVIFLTARGEPADKNQAFISGVDEYITKPYDSDVLLKFVKVQLDRRFRLQNIIGRNFDALKQSILNLVTPDFRQPLSFVSEYTGKLADDLEGAQTDVELRDSLRGIQIGSNWLKRVIEDLMSLAELKTGEAQLAYNLQTHKIPNIGVLLSEFALIHERKLANEDVQIYFTKMDPSIAPIYGDISTLSDSMRRLIEVGMRYCIKQDSNEAIFLSVEQINEEIHIFIQFATPLPMEIFRTIGEILAANIDSTMSSSIDLGPNLSIAKGYIDLHNGRISVKNGWESGCQFTITLPIYKEHPTE